ncbi:MAG: hypothetical protein HUJ26_12415 [Planctomycetaceae bacterium]|nr:hypothetical protein [Planctomycetaceae bacterium]
MMRGQQRTCHGNAGSSRRGVSSAEYVLALSTMIAISATLLIWTRDLLNAVYELISGWVAWPFL